MWTRDSRRKCFTEKLVFAAVWLSARYKRCSNYGTQTSGLQWFNNRGHERFHIPKTPKLTGDQITRLASRTHIHAFGYRQQWECGYAPKKLFCWHSGTDRDLHIAWCSEYCLWQHSGTDSHYFKDPPDETSHHSSENVTISKRGTTCMVCASKLTAKASLDYLFDMEREKALWCHNL